MVATKMVAGGRSRRAAHDVDRLVGQRVRERRIMLGMSQQELGARIGVAFQQAHKYESGVNRISIGRLHRIAQALEVEIAYFFEGVDAPSPPAATQQQRMLLDLMRNFLAIHSPRRRTAFLALVRTLAQTDAEPAEGNMDRDER